MNKLNTYTIITTKLYKEQNKKRQTPLRFIKTKRINEKSEILKNIGSYLQYK